MDNVSPPTPVFTDAEWTFAKIERVTDEIERIAQEELQLDYYPFRLEIISSEQMMDAYTSVGMPINYHHWSFGKQFITLQEQYKRGRMGLAYEIVINANPCIAYLMEENSMTMQTLVIAHAAFGHNAFMKNNYLFKQWTHADAIIDYLAFALHYLSKCEERYGAEEVEAVLDACHALQAYGVDRYTRPAALSVAEEERRQRERWAQEERDANVLWSTLPKRLEEKTAPATVGSEHDFEPQENILYFIEKKAPELPQWKREIIRIVRKIAQYFYPQRQTKVLNEGFATFTHYYIMHRLSHKGLITAGAMQEFLHSHTSVVMQPDFGPINPYALGFNMFMDLKRMCENPTAEDRAWFPDIAGSPWLQTIKFMAESFKDESAIRQFLSPRLIRHFRFFALRDDDRKPVLEITAIHNDEGYRHVRKILAEQHDIGLQDPVIDVSNVDQLGDRHLTLCHRATNRRQLESSDAKKVLHYASQLWGFPVKLEVEEEGKIRAAS
jgi:stage V sporulation protein R